MPDILGVDLGGTWIRMGVLTPSTGELTTKIYSDRRPANWEEFVDLLRTFNTGEIQGFGIAISGPIQDHARVIVAPNVPWLDGRDVQLDLKQAFGKPVVVSNDMEAATEGEMARGVLCHFSWAIFDTISTGWGGNLILNGRRVDGEPGHANVSFKVAQRCNAGHVGCYESLYSGSAIQRRIQEHLLRQGIEVDDSIWTHFDQEVTVSAPWALEILDHWAEGVARAWANTLNRIRPLQAIVYMGTTAESFLAIPRVMEHLRATMRTICMFPEHQADDFPILKAELEHRGIYGAAMIFEKLHSI